MNTRRLTLLGRIAVAACAPYLTLKLLWVLGMDIGVVDTGRIDHASWLAANAFTFLLDAIAALVAHTLTRPRGLRTPAWLLAFPLWMASGLLIPLMLGVPGSLLAAPFVDGPHPMARGDFLEPWVFGVVYGGFIVEGLALFGAFAVYAHRRWGGLLCRPLRDLPDTGTRAVQRILALPAAVLTAVLAVVQLLWGTGSTLGVTAAEADARTAVTYTSDCVQGLLSLAGALGVLLLLFPRLLPRRAPLAGLRVRVPLALAWVGSAVVFGCGGCLWVTRTLAGDLTTGVSPAPGGLPALVGAAELFTGLVLLCAGAFTLAELTSGTRVGSPRPGSSVRPEISPSRLPRRECSTVDVR
ncbi:hypothetical protein ACIRPT_33540 [Streptomyces sp. NPDC101227]|uniref:hypothetical protein n=1 Tax=Streptomyces sp. NPDC101227 TaxID=3366136 RepID=UPI00381AD10E